MKPKRVYKVQVQAERTVCVLAESEFLAEEIARERAWEDADVTMD